MKKNKKLYRSIILRCLCLITSIFFSLSAISQDTSSISTHKLNSNLKQDTIPEVGRPLEGCLSFHSTPLNTNNSFTATIGAANMYDTYLSPLEYKGTSYRLMYEQMRRTTWFDYKFYKQQTFELEFATGDNPAKNASEYWILASYRLGGHYTLKSNKNFRLGIGGLWEINGGVLYNERNGNNPASARGYTNVNLSIAASYKFKWFALRWQIDSPLAGVLFSPEYGQSYYEMSVGNTVGMVNFASLHNQRALRSYITADIPFKSYIIRVGYLGSYYQTKVHDIQTHHYSNSIVIGFPLEGVKRPKEKTHNNYWDGN